MKSNVSFYFLCLFILSGFSAYAKSPISSWKVDMYNQDSVKSQEAGNLITFPIGSVTKNGNVIESDGLINQKAQEINWNDFDPNGIKYNPTLSPANPIAKNDLSLKKGKELYQITCAVCHGDNGTGGTRIAQLRGVPPINASVPNYSDGYLYLKITYGNNNIALMPPYGTTTTKEERWNIVNYIKSTFK